jgi:hypothetical protein
MFSHSINDGSVGGGESNAPHNALCRSCDRGPSVFDVRHNLVMNTVYELPFGPGKQFLSGPGIAGKVLGGWQLSGLSVWHTGHPLTVTLNIDNSLVPDGNGGNARPDVVSGVSVIPQGQNANNWVNPAAFTAPPSDPVTGVIQRFGNAGRGIITAPITWQIDVALEKKIKLTERFALIFTAQAFNVFNHDQLADPNLTLNYNPPDSTHPVGGYISVPGNFGQITSLVNVNSNSDKFAPDNTGSGLPRQIQFSLRLSF